MCKPLIFSLGCRGSNPRISIVAKRVPTNPKTRIYSPPQMGIGSS